MTGLLAFVWFAGSIAGIWFIIKPKPDWPPVANRKRAAGLLAAVFLGLPVLGAVLAPGGASSDVTGGQSAAPKTPEEIAAAKVEEARKKEEKGLRDMTRNPQHFLTLGDTQAYKGGFDTVLLLSGSITNTGKVAYKDPVIACQVFSATDTSLGRARDTLYKEVLPGKTVRFSELNLGFVDPDWDRYSCEVTRAVVKDPVDG